MGVIEKLFVNVDTILTEYVLDVFGNLSSGINTLWSMMVILVVTFFGIRLMAKGDFNPSEGLITLFKIVIIGIITTSWSEFSTFVYNILTNLPSEFGAAILGVSGDDNLTISQSLSEFFERTKKAASHILDGASWFDVGRLAFFLVVMIGGGLFVAFAAGLIVLAKIATAVMLAVAPIFILLLIFRQSQNLFEGWLKITLNYALIPLFVYAILALVLAIAEAPLAELEVATEGDQTAMLEAIGNYLLVSFVSFILLLQVTAISANIAGGFALSTMNAGQRLVASYRGSRRVGGMVFKGASSVYQGGRVAAAATRAGAELAQNAVKRNRNPGSSSI